MSPADERREVEGASPGRAAAEIVEFERKGVELAKDNLRRAALQYARAEEWTGWPPSRDPATRVQRAKERDAAEGVLLATAHSFAAACTRLRKAEAPADGGAS